MREDFSCVTYPYYKEIVKVPGILEKAIKFYSDFKLSYRRLFYDYCDGSIIDEKAYNPWATLNEQIGNKITKDISIHETAFNEYAWKTKRIRPSIYIKSLFYDGENNESAFECGFLLNEMRTNGKDYFITNPSPFLVEKEECCNFLVWDKYFANAYKKEFPNKTFLPYEDINKISSDYTIFSSIKESKDFDNILTLCQNGISEFVISIPTGVYNKTRETLIACLKKNQLKIQKILFLDHKIFESNPKKRIVLYICKGNIGDAIPFYFLCRKGDIMEILPERGITALRHIKTSNMTYFNMLMSLEDKDELKKKNRNCPEEYDYSKEIKVSYTIANRKRGKSLIVSYHPISSNTKKTMIRVEKRIKGLNDNEIKKAISEILLEEKTSEVIVKDYKESFKNRFQELSVKTLWYVFRSDLEQNTHYDDSFYFSIFNDENFELKDMYYSDIISGNINDSVLSLLKMKKVEEQMRIINQINILFSFLYQEKIFLFNPVKDLYKEVSNRMEEEQYEVRNALTKKYFTIEEQIKILDSTGKKRKWIDSIEFETLVLMFRLLTPVPIAEMLPLKWKDIERVEDYGFYRVKIYKKISRLGEQSMHGSDNDWRRFRIVPLSHEVTKKLMSYRTRFMEENGITNERDLDDYPIFATKYKKNKKPEIPSYDKIYAICRKAIDKINISVLEVTLPGEKEVVTDLNKYYSDVFISNYRHFAIHTCLMTNGETNYLLGINAADTFSAHYCDYTNDALQYRMFQKLNRWEVLLYEDFFNKKKKYAQGLEYVIQSSEDAEITLYLKNNFGFDISILKTKEEKEYVQKSGN